MRAKLFPFSFAGWITLGFLSLLESCSSGGGGAGLQNRVVSPGSIGDPTGILESVFAWIAAHMILFVTGLMVLLALSLAIMWLRSRAVFAYIDNVAAGRFDLVKPWNQHGALADSFFGLSLVVQGASFILIVLVLGLGGFLILWSKAHNWAGPATLLAAIPIAFAFVLALLAAALLNLVLRDFVAPLQIARNVGAREASGIFLSLLGAHPGLLIGYAFLKLIASIVVGLVVLVGTCLTCCVGALPLVNQTLFQPVYFAERAWSLKLLAQLGEDVFSAVTPAEKAEASEWDETPTISMSRPPTGPSDPEVARPKVEDPD